MIKIEHIDIYGWEAAVRGMRNSFNSWDKSDSLFWGGTWNGSTYYSWHDILGVGHDCNADETKTQAVLGPNDLKLMQTLSNTGRGSERKYLRYITVTADITAPLYLWKEFDQSKVGTVTNSCSTMHSIAAKEFELDDFSHEHLFHNVTEDELDKKTIPETDPYYSIDSINMLGYVIDMLNLMRDRYLHETEPAIKKEYWWQMIQLLPSSYNQKRTVLLNYEVLAAQYKDRKNHKLDCWRQYCEWIESLPYSELITGDRKDCIKYEKTPLDDEPVDLRNFDYTKWLKEQYDKFNEEEKDRNAKKGD